MEMMGLFGLALGLLAVFGGALLEGLHLSSVLQWTAALIVFGGTLAAILISYPAHEVRRAFGALKNVFSKDSLDPREVIDEVVKFATIARKDGILALDPIRETMRNATFKRCIKYVIDGFEPVTVKEIMESEIQTGLEEDEAAARVWESAAGYAPTLGIIGAVLGLIHVLSNMGDPKQDLGGGIAVAFVATLYGVASANLFFLPFAQKLKRKAFARARSREVILIGVTSIQEGQNPQTIKEKLDSIIEKKL